MRRGGLNSPSRRVFDPPQDEEILMPYPKPYAEEAVLTAVSKHGAAIADSHL